MDKRTRWVAAGIALGFVAVTVTVAGISTIGGAAPSACTIQQASDPVVFCDTFDVAHPVAGTRTGDLDPELWGVSRSGYYASGGLDEWSAATLNGTRVSPPRDVRIINGQLVEAVNDGGGQTILAMYPKQPFNNAGRTGTVAFDVSGDTSGSHAAWPEFWWTDQPVPYPNDPTLSAHAPVARNSVGVKFHAQCPGAGSQTQGGNGPYMSVGSIAVTRNYVHSDLGLSITGCVREGTASAMNHIEIRFSASRVEVWGSDGGSTVLRQLGFANSTLPLTQGVVWLEDVHYNACKFDNQCDHQFTWDNLAFDGPATYRDLSFDVPDAGASTLGWSIPANGRTFTVQGVHHGDKTATGAYVLMGLHTNRVIPRVQLNGGPVVVTPWPGPQYVETIAVPVDPALVRDGANTIVLTQAGSGAVVDNVNLVLINAQTVPGQTTPPTTTTSTTVPPTTTTSTTVPPTTTSTTSTTSTTIPATTTTTEPTTTTTVVPAPVFYPDGYTGEIWVGNVKIWPPDGPPTTTTTTTVPATTTTAATSTTTTEPSTTTTAASTTTSTVPAATTSTVAPPTRFGMLPVGATLPSDATCASRVRAASEQRADNVTANHTFSNGTGTKPNPRYNRVTGNFQGTTDEILQWGACKWGIDEDYVRAQAIVESYWHQNALGDNGESYGLLQVRRPYWGWAFPGAEFSSAYNVDSALAARRACFEGDDTWLNTVERGRDYAAGDIAGCMGMWFSGRWYTQPATQYISAWQSALNQHVWTTPGFVNG